MTYDTSITTYAAVDSTHHKPKMGTIARVSLWVGLAVMTVSGSALADYVITHIAHHASPVGGGG